MASINPVGTKEQREELRRGTARSAKDDWADVVVKRTVIENAFPRALDGLDRQEKGLDIAQEMAKEMALWRGNKPYSYCEILAKWDNWQKEERWEK